MCTCKKSLKNAKRNMLGGKVMSDMFSLIYTKLSLN